MLKRSIVFLGILTVVWAASVASFAQTAPATTSEQIQQTAATALDQVLTYIDSAAGYLGQGVVYVINLVVGSDPETGEGRISSDLQEPIGYLALITLILLLFGLLDMAKRIIWIGIIIGWALLIVRIILDALNL